MDTYTVAMGHVALGKLQLFDRLPKEGGAVVATALLGLLKEGWLAIGERRGVPPPRSPTPFLLRPPPFPPPPSPPPPLRHGQAGR